MQTASIDEGAGGDDEHVDITWRQVLAWRFRRQYLHRDTDPSAVDIARRLGGVQAQVASAAEQAVAVRRPRPSSGELGARLKSGELVKTWAMRGTLHVLPSDEAGAYLALLAAARTWERGSWQRTFLDARQMAAIAEAAAEALDGDVLTREELTDVIMARTGDASLAEHLRSGWGAVLKPLAWQGILCHGPATGGRVTFTSPPAWSPSWTPPPPEEDAARSVVPAYLGVYGPATMEAFGAWLLRGAASRRALRSWFAAAGDLWTKVDVEGTEAFARIEDVDEIAATPPSTAVRLLPAFDQYVLGPGTADVHVLAPSRRADVSRAAGWIAPVLVSGGRVTGTWETRGPNLEVSVFGEERRPPAADLEAEAARLGELLGRKLTLSVVSSPRSAGRG
jgi:hypothetical protein